MDFAIQLVVVLICLFYGARKGGIALGLLGAWCCWFLSST